MNTNKFKQKSTNSNRDSAIPKSVRIILQSFDSDAIEQSSQSILSLAKSTSTKMKSPVRMPTKRTFFSINRGPHIHKTGQDQFEQFHFKRILDFYDISTMTTEALLKIKLSPMVKVNIKLI